MWRQHAEDVATTTIDSIHQALDRLEASRPSSDNASRSLRPPSPPSKWRVALVGGGRLGQYYADAYSTFPDTELVALVEPNSERASAVCEKFGIPAAYAELSEMLDQVKPHILTVATPGALTKPAIAAVRLMV